MTATPQAPATLARQDIAKRVPHQGAMCLLERVTRWDAQQICCEATSHRSPDNPLRAHGRLGAACGVEYAAQAMAVHGALVAEQQSSTAATVGYLVSVRAVELHVDRLDEVQAALDIRAERTSGDTGTVLYSFTVQGDGRLLVSGRAVVVLDAKLPGTASAPNTGVS